MKTVFVFLFALLCGVALARTGSLKDREDEVEALAEKYLNEDDNDYDENLFNDEDENVQINDEDDEDEERQKRGWFRRAIRRIRIRVPRIRVPGWVRRVSIGCTASCYKYHRCRIQTLTLGRCRYPSGCNCSKFAWEGKK